MSNDIANMNDKQLRNEVQLLRDELAIFKRKYEDIIYNLDDDNFSSKLIREKEGMKTSIEVNAEGIKTKVSNGDFETYQEQTAEAISSKVSNGDFESYKTQTADEITSKVNTLGEDLYSQITLTAISIRQEVKNADDGLSARITQNADSITQEVSDRSNSEKNLQSQITQNSNEIKSKVSSTDLNTQLQSYSSISQTNNAIQLAVEGVYDDVIDYYTGIGIKKGEIKMVTSEEKYATFTDNGLKFFISDQKEGWSLEPSNIGGVLNYYYNNSLTGSLGQGQTATTYSTSDMVLKAERSEFARFVVDLTKSGYREIKFVGLNSTNDGSPYIYANEKLLATQEWVRKNGGGTTTAVFA